ncbi:MAG: hypothetical protein AAF203_05605 [Pseudomonadota bacterium]
MKWIVVVFLFVASTAEAQYDEYESYQTFEDLDKYQRDFGLVFSPSFMYISVNEDNQVNGATVTDRTRDLFFYDLRFGYIFIGGFYFGLMYSAESVDINTSSPKNSRESIGLGFGYTRYGWSFAAHVLPYSKQTLTGTADISEYSDGFGFQLDLAYYFRLGRFVS